MELLSYAIVGAIVSLITGTIKNKLGTKSWSSVVAVIALSLIFGGLWSYFADTIYWENFVKILAAASTVYSVLIKQLISE